MRTITVGQLIERLELEDKDAKVIFSTDYGDYSHTPQALPIGEEDFELRAIRKSAYSTSGFALVDEDDDDVADVPDSDKYLVIR